MPFRDVVDPGELALLTEALDEICRRRIVVPSDEERLFLGGQIIGAWSRGARTLEELIAAANPDRWKST